MGWRREGVARPQAVGRCAGRRHACGRSACGPDQDVCVPDGRHSVLGHGLDADHDVVRPIIDRRHAMRLGEREERVGHEVLRIAGREIARQRAKTVRAARVRIVCDGARTCALSAARLAGLFELGRRMPSCRQHDGLARIGCRRLHRRIDPGLQVLEAVDDAAAELRIARTRAVDAVLLERTDGEADEAGGLRVRR